MSEINWSEHTLEEFSGELAALDKLLDTEMTERQLQESGQRLAALEDAIKSRGFYEQLQQRLAAVQKKQKVPKI